MNTGVRPLAALTATAGIAGAAATVLWSREWNAVTVTLTVAAAWGAAIALADACISRHQRRTPAGDPERRVPVTYVVRLGEEPLEIARTSLLLAAQAGPVAVVATAHHAALDDPALAGVREFTAPTLAEALDAAAQQVHTSAVHVMSAGAFPVRDACELAAARITGQVGWVTGTAPAFNSDRFAPGEREQMTSRTRDAARRLGLVTWEPDATVVRTDLLRTTPLRATRPDGKWLRSWLAEGWHGVTVSEPLAVRVAPSDAPMFWPSRTRRQRGAVADLADATTSGPLAARAAAAGALLRELYAYSLALWFAAILMIGHSGRLPLSVAPVVFFSMHGTLALARWISSRTVYGVGLHPVDEARAAAYDLPGSLSALPSALTRTVRPARVELPDEPLLWAALLVTLVTTVPLLDRRVATGSAVGTSVALALTATAAAWVFALRASGVHGWNRATPRLAIDLAATVDGRPARTLDASPAGLSVVGDAIFAAGDDATLAVGAYVAVTVAFDTGTVAVDRARVTDVRRSGDRAAIGFALDLDADARVTWIRSLFGAAGVTGRAPVLPVPSGRRLLAFDREPIALHRRIATVAQRAVVATVSAVVLLTLLCAFVGLRPMVERSGSMAPDLRIGDVVVAEWVRVDQVHAGEIVTFAPPGDPELVTHRVQHVEVAGGTAQLVTKGDANSEPEQWSVPRGTLVGRVVLRVPAVGRLLIVLGTWTTRALLVGVAALTMLLALVNALSSRRPRPRARGAAA